MPLRLRRGAQTTVLVAAVIGSACWIDLALLDAGPGAPPAIETSAALPAEIIVEIPTTATASDGPVESDELPVTAVQTTPGPTPVADHPASPIAVNAARPVPVAAAAPTSAAPVAPPIPGPAPPPTQPATSTPATTITPPTTAAPPSTSPSTSTTLPAAATTTAPEVATLYRTVDFEGVAQVVIADHGDGTIEFWSCTPAPGWAYRVEDDGPTTVKVKFQPTSGGDEAELEIRRRADGSLSVQQER